MLLIMILAGSAGAYIVVINIADYPAPERLAFKLWSVLVVSTVAGGGLSYALFGRMIAGSDPMPGRAILGAAGSVALGLIAGAATAIGVGLHQKTQAGR